MNNKLKNKKINGRNVKDTYKWVDKTNLNELPDVPLENKVTAEDMNYLHRPVKWSGGAAEDIDSANYDLVIPVVDGYNCRIINVLPTYGSERRSGITIIEAGTGYFSTDERNNTQYTVNYTDASVVVKIKNTKNDKIASVHYSIIHFKADRTE
jgi:hypothetical protein